MSDTRFSPAKSAEPISLPSRETGHSRDGDAALSSGQPTIREMRMRKFMVLAASLVLYVSSAYAAKPVLAVAEFRNETHASWWRTDVGTDLASMLTNELAATEKFKMV